MRARIFAPFLAPGQPKPCRNRAAAMLLRPLMPPTPKGCLRLMQRRIQRVALVLIYWPAGYLCDLPVRPLTPAWMGITPARARVGIMPVWAMVLVVGKVVSPVWSNSVYLGHRGRCFLGRRWSLCCKGRRARCIKVGGFSRAQNCADRDDCSRRRNNNTTHDLSPTLIQAHS